MAKITASTPKGTRDFSPEELTKRNHIFQTIRQVFELHGFRPLETPAMENLETLTGKYGEEGDRLIFKILNSGDFLNGLKKNITDYTASGLSYEITEKALRYDLTVPFARYVVQHRNDIKLPFKRYQIQPVWRADKPQKGRYREFYQCDADIIGSDSLWNETELVLIFDEVLTRLGLPAFTIKLNNRKILAGMAEVTGIGDRLPSFLIALDKLDKIGREKVTEELLGRGFSEKEARSAMDMACFQGTPEEKIQFLKSGLADSETGKKGIEETEWVLHQAKTGGLKRAELELDLSLARGIDYYTGAIFEVKAQGVQMGSICGGGRYDNLTGIFGLDGISGVGISFGADRIYDVMEELHLFPDFLSRSLRVLFMNMGTDEAAESLKIAQRLRQSGISCELYPDTQKIPKQFEYAEKRGAEWVVILGSDELKQGTVSLKHLASGEKRTMPAAELTQFLRSES
jgi:histidyl-tRNA synthetase